MAKACKTQSKDSGLPKEAAKKATTAKKNNNASTTKRIIFSYFDPQAHQVLLAGDFNNWDMGNLSLKRKDSGEWNASLNLRPGIYDYRFIVDGEWRDDPKSLERVPNPYGTFNNRITIR